MMGKPGRWSGDHRCRRPSVVRTPTCVPSSAGEADHRPAAHRAPAATRQPDPSIVPAGTGRRAARSVPRGRRRRRPRERRGPRSRADSRLQQPHLRHRQGGADRRDAQRGLRPAVAPDGRRADGGARTEHRQPFLSGRRHAVQRHRRDSRHRQGRGGGDAWRPSRLVACRHRRHRQRDRLRDDARGDPHPAGDRREAAPHDSCGAVERRGTGSARLAGLREGALRHVRKPEAGVRDLRRLLQHRLRHGPRARHDRVRPARGGGASCARRRRPFADNGFFGATATTSRRRGGSDHTSFNEVGLPGIGVQQDPIEYRHAHLAHKPGHLRAHHRGRCAAERDGDCRGGVSPRDAETGCCRGCQKDQMPALPTP